jgi:hypothetical protein
VPGRGRPADGRSPAFASGGALGTDGNPKDLSGPRDSTVKVNFYYRSPDSGLREQEQDPGPLDGGPVLLRPERARGPIDLDGPRGRGSRSFVHFEIDNHPVRLDKDGCEFTLGVLVDAKSPFDGHTLPTASRVTSSSSRSTS